MKNQLTYIPSSHQLRSLRQHLYSQQQPQFQCSPEQPSPSPSPQPSHKLSKSDLDNLVTRLSKNTKNKQIMHQLQRIKQINIREVKKQRESQKEPIEQRLMREGREKLQRRKEMVKEREEEERRNLREKPQISKNVEVQQKHIKDRYTEVIEDKQRHLKELDQRYKPAFAPEINEYSKFIAQIRNENDMNIVNRLQKQGKQLQQKRQRIVNKIDEQLNHENTFKPKINTKTNSILNHNPLFSSNLSIERRAQILSRRKRNTSRQFSPCEPECTFKPKICSKSSKLVGEQTVSVGQRLYMNAQKIKEKKMKKKQQIDRQYSFQPKINTVKIASQYAQESSQSYFESDEESLFEQKSQQPKQPMRSSSMRNSQVKPRYLESSRKQVSQMTTDERQQQRCTFKPNLFKPIKNPQVPQVYGLDNYLRNIDRARRLHLQRASATEKVKSEKYLHSLL